MAWTFREDSSNSESGESDDGDALETSHALAYAEKIAKKMSSDKVILVNLSGRGDKDIHTVAKCLKDNK